MKPQTLLHRLAECLLRAGIRLAPGEAREWGNAMLGELQHIEGNWGAVAWALGGAGVLAKQALVALLVPAPNRQATPVGNPLAGEGKMHKASLVIGGACLAAALLFFLAPVFRQGFGVSLAQWQSVIHVDQGGWYREPGLESFANRMEKNKDAEGMAFVAVRTYNGRESVRLAEEAVRLDPKLLWVLGIVGGRFSTAPGVAGWARSLELWDPGNALPYLILAQHENLEHIADGSYFHRPQPSAAWTQAMVGAFNSKRIDDYAQQLQALERKVAQRYGISDPYYLLGSGDRPRLPSYAVVNSLRYAKLAIASGDALEARGDTKGALEKYLMVARFLPQLDPHIAFSIFLDGQMPGVYSRLADVYKKIGNEPQSSYFAGLAATGRSEMQQRWLRLHSNNENRGGLFGVTPWSALTVELSDAGMLASVCLLLIALIVILVQSETFNPRKLRIGAVPIGMGLAGAVGLLVSSVMLYVAYRPYAAIYTRFLQTGETSQLKILTDFLAFTRTPIGTQAYRLSPLVGGHTMLVPYISTHTFTFYFWFVVTVVGVATLAAIAGRHLLRRFHTHAAAPVNGSVAG